MRSIGTFMPGALLALSAAACTSVTVAPTGGSGGGGGGASSSGDAASSSSSWSATTGTGGAGPVEPTCPATLAGEQVIGCGFPPELTLIGVDAQAVYTLTLAGAFYRVEIATGHRTRLFAPVAPVVPAVTARLSGSALYFAANLDHPGAAGLDLFALAVDQGTTQPTALVTDLAAPELLVGDGFLYFDAASGSALRRAPLGGGATVDLFAQPSVPVALQGGFVYHVAPADHVARRTSVDGATTTVLATGSEVDGRSYDVDADFLYYSDQTNTENIRRCPLVGGAEVTLASFYQGDGDLPGPGPVFGLRTDADSVYFLTQSYPAHHLYRIDKTAVMLSSTSAFDALGNSTSLPVFDATSMFVARSTDPSDGPAEGMITRVPK